MKESISLTNQYNRAAEVIKTAILQSQYQAVQKVNSEQLALYFGIGRYISTHSRDNYWGTSALTYISEKLRRDMPGLRGFSEAHMKKMRIFYEEWNMLEDKSFIAMNDLQLVNESLSTDETDSIAIRSLRGTNCEDFPLEDFLRVPFTHHYTILSKVKELKERYFYIHECAIYHLSVDGLKKAIGNDDYHHQSQMPNNFLQKLTSSELAFRAINAFKDEYMLDFINVEELGTRDIADIDERVVEQKIIHDIKKFIMTFGQDFAFVGNQYHLEVYGEEFFPDLIFFNRELNALVVVELKTGKFKPTYLGQLSTYLRILDDKVRKPHENPSIGIVLCKHANKEFVEYVIQDYDKPMGVATYNTSADMPEKLRKALPDIDELKKLL